MVNKNIKHRISQINLLLYSQIKLNNFTSTSNGFFSVYNLIIDIGMKLIL